MGILVDAVTEAQLATLAAGGPRLVMTTDGKKTLHVDDGAAFYPINCGAIAAQVNYGADGTTTTIGVLPAGAVVYDVRCCVTTAFNAATTNTIKVGYAGTPDAYAGAITVTSAGFIATANGSLGSNGFTNGKGGPEQTQRTVIATYNQSGTAATAGKAIVFLLYFKVPLTV